MSHIGGPQRLSINQKTLAVHHHPSKGNSGCETIVNVDIILSTVSIRIHQFYGFLVVIFSCNVEVLSDILLDMCMKWYVFCLLVC